MHGLPNLKCQLRRMCLKCATSRRCDKYRNVSRIRHKLQLTLRNTTLIMNKHLLSGCLHSFAHLFLELQPVTTAPSALPPPCGVSNKGMTRYCVITASRDSRTTHNLPSTHTRALQLRNKIGESTDNPWVTCF
jgi:hypothetical protein